MNKFEAVILFSPDLSTAIINKEIENLTASIEKNNGKIVNNEDWGLRELSYNIKNYKKAFYKYFQLEMNGSEIRDVKKNLNQNEKILRNLFVKVNEHDELPTKMIKNEEKN